MATLQTTIPDDLSRQVHAIARARGIPIHLLVEEALRCIVSPEPFASEPEALEEMEALESDVLKDLPWKVQCIGYIWTPHQATPSDAPS